MIDLTRSHHPSPPCEEKDGYKCVFLRPIAQALFYGLQNQTVLKDEDGIFHYPKSQESIVLPSIVDLET